jgi:uncharacterized protein YkwD
MTIAQAKADEMRKLNYFAHTSPTGQTVNEFIESRGYRLPDWYPDQGNSCESLRLGPNDINSTINAWLKSPGHRVHVVGENDFFRDQTAIGVGLSEDPDGGTISVFMSAPDNG